MTTETVWGISAFLVAAGMWFWMQLNLMIGLIAGAFVGLIITTVMKMLNFNFKSSGTYSSSSNNRSYDSCDDWD